MSVDLSELTPHHEKLDIQSPSFDLEDKNGEIKVVSFYDMLCNRVTGSFKLERSLNKEEEIDSLSMHDADHQLFDSLITHLWSFTDLSVVISADRDDYVDITHNLVVGEEYTSLQLTVSKDNIVTLSFGGNREICVKFIYYSKSCEATIRIKLKGMILKITVGNYYV